ncbi:CPBP family intramembrane metalloprotease [Neiella sp. HB171785]|uniref:CPBP family intramembrane metalloprotease n=1 Tax=Neiella litorisoli TaxID=2771431 RepID=A0A8J6QHW2_9GAMM|nr:type II CAAX endopeptidase family protein [Neiella litorisoli]MBD1388793.1 CPBP family intramembrane metalloprotease [Neiella litorisoli]
MTEAIIKEDLPQRSKNELLKIAVWLIALLFVPGIIAGMAVGIYAGFQTGMTTDMEPAAFDQLINSPPLSLIMMLGASLLTLPLLKSATAGSSWQDALRYYRVGHVARLPMIKAIGAMLLLFVSFSVLSQLFALPPEPFMETLQAGLSSPANIVLLMVTICLVVPVVEEFVFRGWLFGRLLDARVGGQHGPLLITTILFTLIHAQYQSWYTFAFIAVVGLLLGMLRQRYNNISYAIAAHMALNCMSTLMLFIDSTS